MFVCHCRAVTDAVARRAVAAGARDTDELARRCGAGTGCGGCLAYLAALVAEGPAPHHGEALSRMVPGRQGTAA